PVNPALITSEVVKLVARRGLFLTALALPVAVVVVVVVVGLLVRAYDPDSYEGGRTIAEAATGLNIFVLIVMAALLGATAGAWDVQNGTFRYLAMTGTPRAALVLARVPALLIVIAAVVLPGGLLTMAAAELMPRGAGEDVRLVDHALALWAPGLQGAAYGVVALAVGALLRSVGAAIAVALVLNLAGLQALLLLGLVDDRLADAMLPAAVNRLTGAGEQSLAFAAVALAVWLALVTAAAVVRTVRSEY
ncbi:MAG TPA: ABC transporter permease, partial [Miltoncostaeaceae bacterium]|nr:ABC transporter permease [Miltoncostaeaceae bacterium]